MRLPLLVVLLMTNICVGVAAAPVTIGFNSKDGTQWRIYLNTNESDENLEQIELLPDNTGLFIIDTDLLTTNEAGTHFQIEGTIVNVLAESTAGASALSFFSQETATPITINIPATGDLQHSGTLIDIGSGNQDFIQLSSLQTNFTFDTDSSVLLDAELNITLNALPSLQQILLGAPPESSFFVD